MNRRRLVRVGSVAAAMLLAAASGCEKIHDPWVTGKNDLEEERGRSPEQQKALRDRALYQAGPGGTGKGEHHELSRFTEK